MFPRSEDNPVSDSRTISVTVTAIARPSSIGITNVNNRTPSPTSVPVLDTPTITNIIINSLSSIEAIQSGVPTRTTPTLTPTTLKNIEQFFEQPSLAGQPPEVHYNQAGFVPPPVHLTAGNTFISVDSKGLGGGTITLTQPASVSPLLSVSSPPNSTSSSSRSPSPMVPLNIRNSSNNSAKVPGRRTGGRRPIKDDKITPEEEERRMLRRERNKQAAARCRKRRLDQTNRLQNETDALEEKRVGLQQEIQLLQQQREELEFVLAAHKPSCKKSALLNGSAPSSIEVKEEPMGWEQKAIRTRERKPQRPTTLSLGWHQPVIANSQNGLTDLGIPIETPSTAVRGLGLNFDSMMEGGTGLTPVAVLAPLSSGLTPLSTPVVTTASSNCGTQQRSSSEVMSPDAPSPKLVSL